MQPEALGQGLPYLVAPISNLPIPRPHPHERRRLAQTMVGWGLSPTPKFICLC